MKQKNRLIQFLRQNLLILIIVCVATWLRVWQLDSHGVFFSDAGRDLMVAYQSVQEKTLPLLGIPSSVPRFKQGPVSIWLEMLVISFFGVSTYAQSLVFALLSIAAVIGIYELTCIYLSKKHALIASALLATAPLAVANGRVPYHTTPLPLALVLYLFSLMLLWHSKKYSFFLSSLSFAFLFQFELAMAPLFLLIPFIIWWQKKSVSKNNFIQSMAGLTVGLLPQVIFDLTHKFAQIGVFFIWIGHKLYEFVSFKDGGSVHFEKYFSSFMTYGGRIFSTDYWIISIVVLLITLVGICYAVLSIKNRKIQPLFLITEVSLLLLIAGYFVHGSPSEAYFPPFFILLPIHIACTVFLLPSLAKKIIVLGLTALCIFNIHSIIQHSFFVNNPQKFSYGSSTGEIKRISHFMQSKSPDGYNLSTFNQLEQTFPSLFDNYRWIALENNYPLTSDATKFFYIERKDEESGSKSFMFRDFAVNTVYWRP